MHNRFLFVLFTCALLACGSLRAGQAPSAAQKTSMPPGTVKVAQVNGRVTYWLDGKESEPLKKEDLIPIAARIVTPKDGSVILAFSNRAKTQLGPDSELAIESFLMNPYEGLIKVAEKDEEDTESLTTLRLNRGELTGMVKLRPGSGSKFTVNTPVGAAGIRGTTFRIVFRPDPITGQPRFTLTNVNGGVDFTPSVTGSGSVSGSGLAIPQGEQIVITYTQDAQGQFVPVGPPAGGSPAAIQEALAIANVIAAAVQQVVFSSPSAPTTQISGQTATGATVTGEVKVEPPPRIPEKQEGTSPPR